MTTRTKIRRIAIPLTAGWMFVCFVGGVAAAVRLELGQFAFEVFLMGAFCSAFVSGVIAYLLRAKDKF